MGYSLSGIENEHATGTDKVEWEAVALRRGWTALHYAASRGHRSVVELLLQHKADVGAKAKNGLGPEGKERQLEVARGIRGLARNQYN